MKERGEVEPDIFNNRLEHSLGRSQALLDVAEAALTEEFKNEIVLLLGLDGYEQRNVVAPAIKNTLPVAEP